MITTDIQPNQTLYINNLNHRIHVEDLKKNLFEFFVPYGSILDIVCKKNQTMCGQAFIVYTDITASTNAFRGLQGKEFLGRKVRISYAKTKSDATTLRDGTYKPRPKLTSFDVAMADVSKDAAKEPKKEIKIIASRNLVVFTLFVENMPEEVTDKALGILFRQYPGFVEVRLIEGRQVAFVDFLQEIQAETAMKGLQGFLITPEKGLKISFAKEQE